MLLFWTNYKHFRRKPTDATDKPELAVQNATVVPIELDETKDKILNSEYLVILQQNNDWLSFILNRLGFNNFQICII